MPLRMALALCALPSVLIVILAVTGWLDWGAAGLALIVLAGGAFWLACLGMRDVNLILTALQRDEAAPGPGNQPTFGITATIIAAVERSDRSLSGRQDDLNRVLAAEQAILQLLPDPLIVLAADRSVRRANAAAQTAFGAEMAAVLRHPGLRAAIDRAQAQGESQIAELSLPVPVTREVVATVIALNPPLADGGRIVAILSDRTRDRAVERMRADFVANASHELRTPLASLIGFIDTLRGPAADDPPAQTRFLAIMAEQAQRMNRLIDDLLSLSRIELTEHQPPAERVTVGPLLQHVAASFEPQVAARRIALRLQVSEGLPDIVGDPDQLEQVLQNLMDNAVKYGRDDGEVQVTAAAARGGRWPVRPGILIAVSDDGPGIARAHIPRLTERFYRADKGRSRAVGGTGLGLAIVKHIVIRHRGQLHIESVEAQAATPSGTTVTIWLPAAEAGGAGQA